jgi:glucuronate isomerase
MSFAAIQQLQIDQTVPLLQDKRSLQDIQREEQERRQEEDFLKWWKEEEARVQEAEAAALASAVNASKRHRAPKNAKQKEGRKPRTGKPQAI